MFIFVVIRDRCTAVCIGARKGRKRWLVGGFGRRNRTGRLGARDNILGELSLAGG